MKGASAWAGPAVFSAAAALATVSTIPEAPLRLLILPALAVGLVFLARGTLVDRPAASPGILAVSVLGGLLLMSLAAVSGYPVVAGGPFDPVFLMENLGDAVPTVARSLSPGKAALAGFFLVVLGAAGFRLVRFTRLPLSAPASRIAVIAMLSLVFAGNLPWMGRFAARRRRGGEEFARFPPTAGFTTASDEPVFMLQLESVNSLAEAGLASPDRAASGAEAAVFRDGVFFPFLVAGNMMTTRGQATILCGATWELGDAVARHPASISRPCLPELLRRSGYRTIFYSDSTDPRFGHTRDFAARAGFEETHFGDLARPGDPVRRWGYEDSVYYRRIIESLAARFPDPRGLFVYIAVSADHFPFDEVPERRSDPPALAGRSFRARYLRTLAEQDRALASFRRLLAGYASGAAHLFVVSDHSYPVGVNRSTSCARGASPDNYLTTMAYVPPKSRAPEFCVGSSVAEFYGQESILPTVFEVLNRRRYPRSMGPALWRFAPAAADFPERAPCATFSQPFDGRSVVTVRDGQAFRYSFRDGSITVVDLRRDILERRPRPLGAGFSPETFSARYGCD